MCSNSITALRQELRVALGTNYARYMVVMREWFSDRHNKLDWEFDMPFLSGRAMELHNKLMQAILQLCVSPKFDERKPAPSQTQILFPTSGNGASKRNVMTLHAASEPEEIPSTYSLDLASSMPAPAAIQIPPPLVTSVSVSEEEAEVEEDTADDSKTRLLFLLGLRKARLHELNERPLYSRNKTDWRSAPGFLNELLEDGEAGKRDIFPNVTHGMSVKKYLEHEPELRQYFPASRNSEELFCSSEATLPGKILMKVWEFGIRSIDPHVIPIITRAVEDRIRLLIRELIKERKNFRLKPNGQVQFGEFHVNPYLLSKHHIPTSSTAERRPYSTILVDPITLPADSELQEKNEQMTALMAATSIDSPFRKPGKISPMEVYLLLKSHPTLNLGGVEGQEFLENLLIKGSGSLEPREPPDETESDDLDDGDEQGQLLPIVSY